MINAFNMQGFYYVTKMLTLHSQDEIKQSDYEWQNFRYPETGMKSRS